MDKYKRAWNKLKSHIENEEILKLMDVYELELKSRKLRSSIKGRGRKYPIKISDQPWYNTYQLITNTIRQRKKRDVFYSNKDLVENFKHFERDFYNWTKKIALGKESIKSLTEWLNERHKLLLTYRHTYTIKKSKLIIKSKFTNSGFERKPKSTLTQEEIKAIVIDDLITLFNPKIPKEFENLDIKKYEEDWKQELWKWCWECADKDPNLNALISHYNHLPRANYSFHMSHILSRMNKYIVSYIAKLQYSCSNIADYHLNEKYYEEELYPADDISVLNDFINTADYQKYIVDPDAIIDTIATSSIIKEIIEKLDQGGFYSGKYYISSESAKRYKQVLEMRYGFNSKNHVYTLNEIGMHLGVSRERVRQMESWLINYIKRTLTTEEES